MGCQPSTATCTGGTQRGLRRCSAAISFGLPCRPRRLHPALRAVSGAPRCNLCWPCRWLLPVTAALLAPFPHCLPGCMPASSPCLAPAAMSLPSCWLRPCSELYGMPGLCGPVPENIAGAVSRASCDVLPATHGPRTHAFSGPLVVHQRSATHAHPPAWLAPAPHPHRHPHPHTHTPPHTHHHHSATHPPTHALTHHHPWPLQVWDQGQGDYIEGYVNWPTCPARPRPPSPPAGAQQPPMMMQPPVMMYLEPPFAAVIAPPSGEVDATGPPGSASQPPVAGGPAAAAPPAPTLDETASSAGPPTSTSSSVPVGAIVGGVVGGIGELQGLAPPLPARIPAPVTANACLACLLCLCRMPAAITALRGAQRHRCPPASPPPRPARPGYLQPCWPSCWPSWRCSCAGSACVATAGTARTVCP